MKFPESIVFVLFTICWGFSSGQTLNVPATELVRRHAGVLSEMGDSDVVAMKAAPEDESGSVRYRPDGDWFWLTGRDHPGEAFMLFNKGMWKEAPGVSSVLFADGDVEKGRFDTVVPVARYNRLFGALKKYFRVLYTRLPGPEFVFDWTINKGQFLHSTMMKTWKEKNPGSDIRSVTMLTSRFRALKSDFELAETEKAIALTGNGLQSAMKLCRPGLFEWNLQAAVEQPMREGGAAGTSFPSIVGSGPNGLVLHHSENGRKLVSGDLVVMDVGAWYNGYSADITRTIPVTGRFTDEQRKLYDLVLRAQNATIEIIKPGITMGDLQQKVQNVFEEAGYPDSYMPHGVSHPMGVDVHDVAPDDTLRAGMIITIEPGLYVPAGDMSRPAGIRGTGIRIEDDVLVTADGHRVLSVAIPRKAEEIEKIMEPK